jgi:tripartite-type tricarboxylate transporter receptor subunit TctC
MIRQWLAAFAMLAAGAVQARAQDDVAGFYAGKTIRLLIGPAVGTGYDVTARLMARHIVDHIPGRPTVIAQSMPGAGSLLMTNSLYNQGPFDGTALGASHNGMPAAPMLTPEAARFDVAQLIGLGSTNRETQISYAWHATPIKSIADVLNTEFTVGSQAPGSSMNDFPVVLNALFGTRFKVINGYKGTADIHKAMEAGEVQGIGAANWTSLLSFGADLVKDNKVVVFGQYALKPHPDLLKVPMWLDLAKSDADKQAMNLLLSRLEAGRPFFLPPHVPAPRVAALRAAFDATLKDPAFLAEAEKAKLEIDPMSGEEVTNLVAQLTRTAPAVAERVRNALAAK